MIELTRFAHFEDRTIGQLKYKNYTAWTLELCNLANEPNKSSVPEGEYRCVYNLSPQFNRLLWLVTRVPGRSGIRIHAANKPSELLGCIAVGYGVTANLQELRYSSEALEGFHKATAGKDELLIRIRRGEIWEG